MSSPIVRFESGALSSTLTPTLPYIVTLAISLLLSGCFGLSVKSSGKLGATKSLSEAPEKAVSTAIGETKAIATVDPDSKTSTALTAPSVQGLTGASVVIAPGSLSISANIVVEQASDFGETSMVQEMGLADDIQVASASPGMIIRPTENVDLKKPMTLAMPLPSGFGFRLADTASKYAIFYKYFDPEKGHLVTGFKVVDDVKVILKFDEVSGRDLIHFDGFFGAYWATILSRAVKPSEVPIAVAAVEPIVNKANVSVIETKGIVRETEIVVKQAIPEIVWAKPSLKLDSINRIVTASVPVPAGRTVQNCKADLFEGASLPFGVSVDADGTNVEFKVLKVTEHSLVARFRCIDDQGRTAVTPWSDSVIVPAAVIPVAAGAGICTPGASAVDFAIQTFENGVLVPVLPLTKGSGCKYSADIYMDNDETKSFYLTKTDMSYVCGLPNHTIHEGSQTLTCEKATAANVGNNFMQTIRGNYTLTVDFSVSESSPTATFTKIPCSTGDLYIQFSSSINPTSFPTPTESQKMVHMGACEFLRKFTSSPIPGDGAVTVRNLTGSFSCGETATSGNTTPNAAGRQFSNSCGSGHRFFNITAGESGVSSYNFDLRTGPSAQSHFPGDSSANDYFSYEVESSCPRELFIYSDLLGQSPGESNRAHRNGACRYEFVFAADDITPSKLAFQLGNYDKSRLCGASSATPATSFTADCTATRSPALIASPVPGGIYRLQINGNAATGNLTTIVATPQQISCETGLYLSNSLLAPTLNLSSAFTETKACVFEKVWTPASANEGFFLQAGSSPRVCGADGSSYGQPSLDGSFARGFCRSSGAEAADLNLIRPLNAVVGTNYKVTVDYRFGSFDARTRVEPVSPLANCPDDLFIAGTGAFPSSIKAQSHGACLYSTQITYNGGSPNQFYIRNGSSGSNCVPTTSSVSNTNRIALFDCSNNVGSALNVSGLTIGHSYRFFFKRANDSTSSSVVMQDLTPFTPNYTLVNEFGNGLAVSTPVSSAPYLGPPRGGVANNLYWQAGADTRFVLKTTSTPNSICGLAPGVAQPVEGGAAVDMNCGIPQFSLASARKFENGFLPGQNYFVDILPAPTFESKTRMKISRAFGFAQAPQLTFLAGTGTPNVVGALTTTIGISESNASPGSVIRSATWTDDDGKIWSFGGDKSTSFYKNDLWVYDPNASTPGWSLHDGLHTAFNIANNFSLKPGSRTDAQAWYDQTHNRLYLYGGFGRDSNGNPGNLNDLWYYNIAGSNWVFVSGGLTQGNTFTGGAPGDEDPAYNPGSRQGALTFSVGTFHFMFGGAKDNGSYLMNDMWRFSSITNEWAFISGNPEAAATPSASLPSARVNVASWANVPGDGNAVYLYGGYLGGGVSRELWRLNLSNVSDPASITWSRIKGDDTAAVSAFAALNRTFHPLNAPGDSIDYHYGVTSSTKGELWLVENGRYWVYSRNLDQWAIVMPDEVGNNPGNTTPTFIPAPGSSNRWPNFMAGRFGANVWSGTNDYYMFGGMDNQAGGSVVRNDLWHVAMPISNAP